MKKLTIISALFLGFTLSGMSQSTIETEVSLTVIGKVSVQDTLEVYGFRATSGAIYESMPIHAQLQVGEVIIAHSRGANLRGSGRTQTIYYFAKEVKDGAMDDIPAGKTVVENERTGLLFLK